ncbi:YcnI family protein [Krasilnikovia sp. MM14-A1004]|uniref:YcnI family copper-binding membrane protein n=1 Tax=Krasilnikovia sp. MM14-A1004 TaxID=3373541 RepID=UPI00399D3FA6
MLRTVLARATVVAGVAAVTTLALAGPASAHVTVNPNNATQGGYTKVAFRVPNEKDTANTTAVEVNLPADTPIASVSLKPLPGWTATTVKSKLATPIKKHDTVITEAVSKITWTAADANSQIKPGQFQEFEVSLGPLPEVDQIVFKALQTYSDGDIVRWIDVPAAGQEAEHPAPILKLAAGNGDPHAAAAAAPAATGGHDEEEDGANWLGLAGLGLGLAGLVAGLLAYRRAGQRSSAAAASA